MDLPIIEVADSKFFGFVKALGSGSAEEQAMLFQQSLKERYPGAAHVPVCWVVVGKEESGYEEDGEPPGSIGPTMTEEVRQAIASAQSPGSVALVVVRFFGNKLLGVTCGRLPQCYGSISRLALHRFFQPGKPLRQNFELVDRCLFGLAAGDCELILDVVPDTEGNLLDTVVGELSFDGFKGASGEVLPRLQNLQADVSTGFIPVYRYPGNYNGDEWETFEWGQTSLKIKEAVETRLLPLVDQEMNHCVTNYYRNGDDFIDHHSDKDLDLNKNAVIVSVSLGDERILELRRRAEPQDTIRLVLPHRSMLVLGPKTNGKYTHSILKTHGEAAARVSLTLRDVRTFMDKKTGLLFGQGVLLKSIDEARSASWAENNVFLLGFCTLGAYVFSSRKSWLPKNDLKLGVLFAGAVTASSMSFRLIRKAVHRRREEKLARDFFSRTSSSGTKY